jgi:hypothetical protein
LAAIKLINVRYFLKRFLSEKFTLVAVVLEVLSRGVTSVNEGPLSSEEGAWAIGKGAVVEVEQLAVVGALVAAVQGRSAEEFALDFAGALASGFRGSLELFVDVEVEGHVLGDLVIGNANAGSLEDFLGLASVST